MTQPPLPNQPSAPEDPAWQWTQPLPGQPGGPSSPGAAYGQQSAAGVSTDTAAYPSAGYGAAGGDLQPPKKSKGKGGKAALTTLALAGMLGSGLVGGAIGAKMADDPGSSGGTTTVTTSTTGEASGSSQRPNDTIAGIAARAVPSVVTVKTSDGTGSGWVYDTQGHIITNNHVIESAANGGKITVQFADGRTADATLVGRDSSYDIAVLKADVGSTKPLAVGSSNDVVVGDEVVAVGAPLGLSSTVTSGIVSALDRPVSAGSGNQASYINAIQTDAAINPGNSGGPLLDSAGQVIGVNSAIAQIPGASSGGQSGSIGVGFAIPSDQVRKTADQIIKTGKAEHPIIGVSLDLRYQGNGAKVMSDSQANGEAVVAGGPAAKAGIKPGDIITKFDGKAITSAEQLIVQIRARSVGDQVKLTIQRGGSTQEVTMTLEAGGN